MLRHVDPSFENISLVPLQEKFGTSLVVRFLNHVHMLQKCVIFLILLVLSFEIGLSHFRKCLSFNKVESVQSVPPLNPIAKHSHGA